MRRKVLILGWDCGAPDIVFNKLPGKLPAVGKVMAEGYGGRLRSCHPPITIPAWQVMVTGRDPGELGLYGFRHRIDNSYTEFSIATSAQVSAPRIWDIIAREGKKSILSGIPPSYPVYPVNGWLIPCFLTPDNKGDYTYPTEIKNEIEQLIGPYPFDILFRTDDKESLKNEVFDMTEKHFRVFEHLLKSKDWDFAMHVEIGLDRVQHGFWRYFDPSHHLHEPESPFKEVIPDYYKLLDKWLGRFMELIDEDTLLIVASDHGAKAMKGAFCVNQWLEKEGYLVFENKPEKVQGIRDAKVNWKKTLAWGWGGYYSRIFFNVKGREKEGMVKLENLPGEIEKLKEKINNLTGPDGEKWETLAYTPQELYENPRGKLADLMVFWDNLSWRAAGTVGHESMYLLENDTGPDDGVHDWDGMFLAWKKNEKPDIENKVSGLTDVFKMVMSYLKPVSQS